MSTRVSLSPIPQDQLLSAYDMARDHYNFVMGRRAERVRPYHLGGYESVREWLDALAEAMTDDERQQVREYHRFRDAMEDRIRGC